MSTTLPAMQTFHCPRDAARCCAHLQHRMTEVLLQQQTFFFATAQMSLVLQQLHRSCRWHLLPHMAESATTTFSNTLRAHCRRIMYTFAVARRGATTTTAKSNGDAALFSLTALYDDGIAQSFYRDNFCESETHVMPLTLCCHRHIID